MLLILPNSIDCTTIVIGLMFKSFTEQLQIRVSLISIVKNQRIAMIYCIKNQ